MNILEINFWDRSQLMLRFKLTYEPNCHLMFKWNIAGDSGKREMLKEQKLENGIKEDEWKEFTSGQSITFTDNMNSGLEANCDICKALV